MDKRFGLQLYSLREDTAKDAALVLKKVAEMGFQSIEFAGYYGIGGKEMKMLLEDLGLKAISSHVGYHRFTDNFKEEVEFNHAVGNTNIVLPWYKIDTLEDAKKSVEEIGKMREAFLAEGFDFGRIAVERNGDIVPKGLYGQTVLRDGDTLEVVRFVGGG